MLRLRTTMSEQRYEVGVSDADVLRWNRKRPAKFQNILKTLRKSL